MADPYTQHRLDELMDELDLGNRTLARLIDPAKSEGWRTRIVDWRKGRMMAPESAERVVAGLQAAGWQGTIEDFVIEPGEGPERPASPESLQLLERRVGEVEQQLRLVVEELRQLRGVLPQSRGEDPPASLLPRRPSAECP